MSAMKRVAYGILVLLIVIIGSCSVPYVLHNRALSQVSASYQRIKHPTSSVALGNFSKVGLAAGGNGNHCDYLAGEIRESDDSPHQIKQFYSELSVPMLDPSTSQWANGSDVPVSIEFPDTEANSGVLKYDIPEVVRAARPKQTKKTLYVVYVLDGGYEPNGDLRCH
jgi:hypothetical protein